MKLLREAIRNLILEIDDDYIGMTPEEEERWQKYHNVERANTAVDEITGIFKFKDWWEAGPWMNKYKIYELEHEPEANCVVRIRVYSMWGGIFLDELETTPHCEGRGYATQVINMLKDVATKHQVVLNLKAKAFHVNKGEGRMSTSELEKWYASQGFVKKAWYMEWTPR